MAVRLSAVDIDGTLLDCTSQLPNNNGKQLRMPLSAP
jgi:hypothetical protein